MSDDLGHEDDRPSITETKMSLYEMMIRGLREMNTKLQRASRILADSDRPPPASDEEAATVSRTTPTPVH